MVSRGRVDRMVSQVSMAARADAVDKAVSQEDQVRAARVVKAVSMEASQEDRVKVVSTVKADVVDSQVKLLSMETEALRDVHRAVPDRIWDGSQDKMVDTVVPECSQDQRA